MEEQVKRRYRAPRRAQQAEVTRRAILDAALELFTRQGFADTSVREVAELAQVSEQTIYNGFTDKIGLLHAAGVAYAELAAGQADAAFVATLRAEPDPLRRIRLAARESRELWEGGALEMERLVFGPEPKDPRLQDLERRTLGYKLEGTREVCEILFPDDVRRPGLDLEDIVTFATAIDSAAVVSTVLALGWSMDRWEAWVVQLLELFLDPSLEREPRRRKRRKRRRD